MYVALVRNGPATAYSIGRQIAKPTANVYKAGDALEAKGAVVSAPGESRVLHAVPPEEFLSPLSKRQVDTIERIADSFRKLNAAPVRSGLFQLESTDAVLERAGRMLSGAAEIAVIDCFPAGLEKLRTAMGELLVIEAHEVRRSRRGRCPASRSHPRAMN